ncbi:MAG: hypothetical protein ACKOWC_10735 [Limnohabitans sp.]
MSTGHLQPQQGAATLLLVLALVLLATLASTYSSRAILSDLLASQGMGRASQARLSTHAAMATAESALMQADASTPDRNPFARQTRTCPADLQGAQWQCSSLPLPMPSGQNQWQWSATLARDLVDAPHVWQIRAQAVGVGSAGQAGLRESVFMPVLPPAPTNAPEAALILNGCASQAAGSLWQICPLSQNGQPCAGAAVGRAVHSHFVPDTDENGSISTSEREACMAFTPASLPSGGTLTGPQTPIRRNPCNRSAWRSVFGDITPAQLQAWSQAQAAQGLHTRSQPSRSIYWIDSSADWTEDLGSTQAPVLLVFSAQACTLRCPRIAPGVHIRGTVYVDAGCDDEKMRGWQASWVEGQVVIEAGLPQVTGNSRIWARPDASGAYALYWPEGMDASRVQRVPGSRSEDLP